VKRGGGGGGERVVAKGGGEEGVGEGVAVDGWPNQDDGPTGRKRNSCMRFPFIFFIRKKKENKRKGAGRRRGDGSVIRGKASDVFVSSLFVPRAHQLKLARMDGSVAFMPALDSDVRIHRTSAVARGGRAT
jgi:hypothetical protein